MTTEASHGKQEKIRIRSLRVLKKLELFCGQHIKKDFDLAMEQCIKHSVKFLDYKEAYKLLGMSDEKFTETIQEMAKTVIKELKKDGVIDSESQP